MQVVKAKEQRVGGPIPASKNALHFRQQNPAEEELFGQKIVQQRADQENAQKPPLAGEAGTGQLIQIRVRRRFQSREQPGHGGVDIFFQPKVDDDGAASPEDGGACVLRHSIQRVRRSTSTPFPRWFQMEGSVKKG